MIYMTLVRAHGPQENLLLLGTTVPGRAELPPGATGAGQHRAAHAQVPAQRDDPGRGGLGYVRRVSDGPGRASQLLL